MCERHGVVPGTVDVHISGTDIVIEIETHDDVVERDGRLVITGGPVLTADDLRELRLADQR